MKYYEVHLPGKKEPVITSNVRKTRNLPEGTKVVAIMTDRYGDLLDTWELPVKDGRVIFPKKGDIHSPNVILHKEVNK